MPRRSGGRTATAVLATALALTVGGCGGTQAAPGAGGGPEVTPDNPRGGTVKAGRSETAAAVKSANEFAADLFGRLGRGGDNTMISPSSVATVLAMLYPGAKDATATEIAKVLHTDKDPAKLAAALGTLDADLRKRSGKDPDSKAGDTKLNITNSVWSQQGLPLDPKYDKLITDAFGGGLRQADFQRDPELARKVINDHVAKQTENKVKDLFPEGAINKDSRLVLTNALYLDAKWKHPFPKEGTKNAAFQVKGGSKADVPMMFLKQAEITYGKGSGWEAIELPYKDGGLAMDIVLPDDLDAFKKDLDAAKLAKVTGSLKTQAVNVKLPKFTFDSRHDLNEPLNALGMRSAFTPAADFSGLFQERQDRLAIQKAIQKAHVAVDEAGTTAAAASGVSVGIVSAPAGTVNFTADRPFLFMIRDTESGQILFLGQVTDPSK